MISIIHPSRSRPEKSLINCFNWITQAHCDVELIVSVDADDPMLEKYAEKYAEAMIINENKSVVDAVNNAAKIARGDIMVVIAEDTECFYGWGKNIEKHMHGKCDWILKTQDGIQDWVITMPLMDRTYYERFGYIYHPSYTHMFCDTDLTCVAELTGRKLITNFNFPHNHYETGKCERDAISDRADVTFESGRRIFTERLQNKFGINNPEGQLSDNIYTRMK